MFSGILAAALAVYNAWNTRKKRRLKESEEQRRLSEEGLKRLDERTKDSFDDEWP